MEYHWQETRDKAAATFGDYPTGQLEQDIIDQFEQRPAHVIDVIDRIIVKVQAGKVRSGWAVVRKELLTAPSQDRVATDEAERDKRITRAKQWIDNAGLHYDREDHVLADLFGDEYAKGPLTNHDTPELRAELTTYWNQARPRGVQADKDFEAWNAKAKADRALVLALRSKPTSDDIDFT